MATITVPIYGQLGPLYAGHPTAIWYEISEASGTVVVARNRTGVTERMDYSGQPSGVYRAIIAADVDWDYPLIIEWTMSGPEGEGILAVSTVGWEFALMQTKGATLNLDQELVDTEEETVGGALSGAWALAWGKLYKNLVNKTLNLFGPKRDVNGSPSKVFQLDNTTNPTTRDPLE